MVDRHRFSTLCDDPGKAQHAQNLECCVDHHHIWANHYRNIFDPFWNINSVHSFTQSEIGPAFLVFLAVVLVVGFTLLFRRIQMLESEHKMEAVLTIKRLSCSERYHSGMAFTVLLGTTFPLLAEAIRGTKLSIQAPFFNTIMAPMGYVLFFLMGIGTVIAWRKSSKGSLRRNFQNPMITATVGTIILAVFIPFHLEAFTIFWIAIFVTVTILIEVGKAAHVKGKQLQAGPLVGLIHVSSATNRYGGLVIHLGVVRCSLALRVHFSAKNAT